VSLISEKSKEYRFRLGVCYYPEQWPESLWEDDYRRMRDMGLDVIRVGEFAWSIFEPEEGKYDFDLFDRTLALAHRYGLEVVFGTPTATPPAWLTSKYPEVLNCTREGVGFQHGMRGHVNHTAPALLRLAERISGKLAEHYADHPSLIGWQIDNELNCEINSFYSLCDHVAFREWLVKRYETLNNLNIAWGTVFWNQTYSEWSQVHLTRPTPSHSPNPHQLLDEKRFYSDATIRFAKVQSEAIRRFDRKNFITTNGVFKHLDSHRLTEECLDFISFDNYPQFGVYPSDPEEQRLRDRRWSSLLAEVRDISKNFYVLEQQSGAGGWPNRMEQTAPKPGQMRLWTYQAIAHGADALLYFRWRTSTFGNEIYWQGINDPHNQLNRRCEEVALIGREVKKLDAVVGSAYEASVATVETYENVWDGEHDSWHGPYQRQSLLAWYTVFQHRHVPCDRLKLRESTDLNDLKRYATLILGHAAILTDEQAELLKQYVSSGGVVVFACRTGYKDTYGHVRTDAPPGPVAELCGISVEEFTRIEPLESEPKLDWAGQQATDLDSGPFNDILRSESADVQILARYGKGSGHYEGKAAVSARSFGRGRAYYFGGVFNVETVKVLADHLKIESPAANLIRLPLDIELAIRVDRNGNRFFFLLNYLARTLPFETIAGFRDILTDEVVCGPNLMPAYGVKVLVRL
jgi:beta-galactosidase